MSSTRSPSSLPPQVSLAPHQPAVQTPRTSATSSPLHPAADAPLRHTKTRPEIKWTVNELAAVKGEIESIFAPRMCVRCGALYGHTAL